MGRKRVHRLYKLEGLQVRMGACRGKRISLHRGAAPTATTGGQYWRWISFMIRWLTEGHFGLSVVDAMNQVALERDLPYAITVYNGTEFTSKSLDEWCYLRGVKLDFIRPGNPTENAFIESFNGRLRDECLNVNEFVTLEEARRILQSWRHDCNHHRPQGLLGHLTPNEFAISGQKNDTEARNSSSECYEKGTDLKCRETQKACATETGETSVEAVFILGGGWASSKPIAQPNMQSSGSGHVFRF